MLSRLPDTLGDVNDREDQMAGEKKRNAMFMKILCHEDALKVVRDCGNGFFVVAGRE